MAEDKNNILPSNETAAPIRPSDITKIAPTTQSQKDDAGEVKKLKTIKLKPLQTVAPASSISEEETISMKQEDLRISSISLTKDENATGDIENKNELTTSEDEDATVKITRAKKLATEPTPPPIPGVKQTIKLRPSTGEMPTPEPAAAPASKQTLKLTPTPPPAQSQPEQAPQAQPKQTIKLTPKKPSEPTVKLDTPEPPAAPEASQPSSSKRTLKLKTQSAPPPMAAPSDAGMATEHGAPPAVEPPQMAAGQYQPQMQYSAPQASEASALTTVAASISMIALGYFAYLLFSQFKDLFM